MHEIGFLNVAWWVPPMVFLVSGHLTNASTTIYLHRCVTHRGLTLSPVIAIPMRLWLWLSTGVVTREWVACHRKHHGFVDREGDPHSPVLEGLRAIVFKGWQYYRRAVREPGLLDKYGQGVPTDWLERWIFTRLTYVGVLILLGIDIYLLGLGWGLGVWIAQVIWMPFLGGLVNGIGHRWGYRNFKKLKDHSRNFFPLGLLLGGEELHNNHHADPRSARFRWRWWEFDIGWIYIRILAVFGLAKVLHARSTRSREAKAAATEAPGAA